jgi:hypothetical protein
VYSRDRCLIIYAQNATTNEEEYIIINNIPSCEEILDFIERDVRRQDKRALFSKYLERARMAYILKNERM